MGRVRAFSPHVRWSLEEEAILREHYATAARADLEMLLTGRRPSQIQCKANLMGLARTKPAKRTPEQIAAAKREGMARQRARDIEAARARGNAWRAANKDRINAKVREETAKRIFWARALRIRGGVTAWDLWRLWKRQRGRCALTGERLDRTAELDHRLPKVRGGTDAINNLQWVTHRANFAKRDLTVEEFYVLCCAAARWIGLRIELVEEIAAEIEREAAA